MHPVEQKSVLDSMVILVDTREQDTPRLRLRLNKMECPYERQKLDFGDYSAKFPDAHRRLVEPCRACGRGTENEP